MCDTELVLDEPACEFLIHVTEIRSGDSEFRCDRTGMYTCYGLGWCPLRNTEPRYTPKKGWLKRAGNQSSI